VILGLVMAASYNSCQSSRNIRFESKSTTTVGNPMVPAASKVLSAVCSLMTECRSDLSFSSCQNGVLNTTGVDAALGLTAGSYATYSAMLNAEEAGTIAANDAMADSCYVGIASLSCSSSTVQAAYNPSQTDPFSGVAAMVDSTPSTCNNVYLPWNNTYYVSVSGNDGNSCAQAQNPSTPKRTIKAGLACVGAGQTSVGAGLTVQVADGTYDEQLMDVIPSGQDWAKPFTLKAANPRGANLAPSSPTANQGVISFNGTNEHHIIIDGFVLDAGTKVPGIRFSAWNKMDQHSIRILNNEVKRSYCTAIGGGGPYMEVIGNLIHQGANLDSAGCSGMTSGYWAHNWLIERNEISGFSDIGLVIFTEATPDEIHDTIVRANVIHDNVSCGMLIGGRNHLIYNNVAYNNTRNGIRMAYTRNANNKIYNNTVHGNGYNINGGCETAGICDQDGQGNEFRNNIVSANAGAPFVFLSGSSGQVVSNNLCTVSGTGCATVGSPQFVNAAAFDFHLQSGSPAIDAGVALLQVLTDFDGTARPKGAGYDIGAFEH
jgi:parallel beta-helix repeat protein